MACILTCGEEAGDDGVGVFLPEGQELSDTFAVGFLIQLEEGLFIARRAEDREPVFLKLIVIEICKIQHQLKVHVKEAGHILRALDVPAHPVKGVGDAREHDVAVAPVGDRLLCRGGQKFTHVEKICSVDRIVL